MSKGKFLDDDNLDALYLLEKLKEIGIDVSPMNKCISSLEYSKRRITDLELEINRINNHDIKILPSVEIETGTGGVYFIQASNGLVKIGIANDIRKRLNSLRSSSPCELHLVSFVREYKWTSEDKYQKLFRGSHSHGEWFFPSDELVKFVTENNKRILNESEKIKSGI